MIGEMDDIDSVLKAKLPRGKPNIMDAPVPPVGHYPINPTPAGPMSPDPQKGRPSSYSFEQNANNGNHNIRQSKSHGDKLIDIEDEQVAVTATPTQAPPKVKRPPRHSATCQRMWNILQSKKVKYLFYQ